MDKIFHSMTDHSDEISSINLTQFTRLHLVFYILQERISQRFFDFWTISEEKILVVE